MNRFKCSSFIPDVLKSIPTTDTSYVHRYGPTSAKTRYDIEPGMIQTENHAFYMGKIFPEDWKDFVAKVRSKSDAIDDVFYSSAFIKGVLNFLSHAKADGAVATIVIGRELGEMFNGQKELEGALSTEEMKEYLYRIAKQFGFTEANLKVVSMSEEHPQMFATLEGEKDAATGLVNGERVYAHHIPEQLNIENPNLALDIASLLQKEMMQNGELRSKIEATVPSKANLSDEEIQDRSFYGLTEISIRLADLARGRVFQGGHMRQKVYDEVIRYIYVKKGGSAYLDQIYDLVKDKDFGRLYIHEEDNPFEKKVAQNVSRVRTAFYAIMAAGLMGVSGYAGMRVHEHKQTKLQRESLDHISKKLSGTPQFRNLYISTPEGHIRNYFNQIKESEDLLVEYFSLPSDISKELALEYTEFLINNSDAYPLSTYSGFHRKIGYLSIFLESKRLYFINNNIPFPKVFSNTPARMYDEMLSAFRQMDNVRLSAGIGYSGGGREAVLNDQKGPSIEVNHINKVLSIPVARGKNTLKMPNTVYSFEHNGKSYYIAGDKSEYVPYTIDSAFVRSIASEYIRVKWAQELASLMRANCSNMIYTTNRLPQIPAFTDREVNKFETIVHPSGKMKFDFIVREVEIDGFRKCNTVYARKTGETDFTYKTGMELMDLYNMIYYEATPHDSYVFNIDY